LLYQPELDPGDESTGLHIGYVYDLYYTSVTESDGLVDLDNLLSVHPVSQSNWEYEDHEDSSDMTPEEDDDDDPNDENNWRNDYPDSDHRFVELISVYIEGHTLWCDRGLKLSNNLC
jgi:hypothetical protein